MASKISGQTMYLPVTPYKVDGVSDEYNELSVRADYDDRRKHFYVSLHPGWGCGSIHGCMILGNNDPMTATTWVIIENSPRNSQKKLDEMYERLLQAKDIIVALFDHREWEKLKNAIINVCRVGYTDAFREQAEKFISENKATANNDNNDNLNNSETMATNAKGADLIGKTIVVNGSNVKYVIKSVDGDKLMTDFIMGDRTMPCPVPMSQVESMVEAGKWTIESEECRVKSEESATATEEPTPTGETTAEEPTATEEVEEVIDEPEPVKAATVKMQPKDKAEEKATKSKPQKPQTKAKSDTSHQHSALKYETYTTKKGKTGAKIVGFHETDAAYLAGPELHGSKAWENDKQGNKTFCLLFSHRYAKAAEDVCKALNAGKSVADCQAIIDGCTEERAQRREEWRARRDARDNAATTEGEATAKTEKLYTEAEVRKAFATLAEASGVDVKEFEPIIEAMRAAA
jgi:hypothetical protein